MNNFNWQGRLKAGANVTIKDGVISASGGGGSGDVTLDTAQTITGVKTFTNGIKNNLIEVNGNALVMKNSAGTGSAYFKIEQVYNSGYKNWFGLNFIRTTGTTQENLAVMEVRQDNYLYIVGSGGLKLNGGNIELTGATSITGTTTIAGTTLLRGPVAIGGQVRMGNYKISSLGHPTDDDDAATKKYVDDAIAAAIKP